MLRFICPHCENTLRVLPVHLGQKGRCNKCGGQIALLGRADARGAQSATAVGSLQGGGQGQPAPPATEQQVAYLRDLGVREEKLRGLDRERASEWIRQLREQRQHSEPPTEKQLQHLRRLGAPERLLQRVRSKAAASALIEEMHLRPTPNQLALLRKLGARGEELARIRTRADASAAIEEMMQQR